MEKQPPKYIESKDVEFSKNFGKLLRDNATWNVTTKELMEVFQYLMWYNSLSSKLQDNIFEVKNFTSAEEMQKEPVKKSPKKGK